jgi:hypothetical protein
MLDRRLLGWGLFFIILGAVPLAVRANVLDPEIVRRWPSLWPLLLIGWGFGLVVRRTPLEWVGGAVTVVTFGLMAGGALAAGFGGVTDVTGCGDGAGGQAFATQSGELQSPARLNVELSCGSVVFATGPGNAWSVSGTESRGRIPETSTSSNEVSIEPDGGSFFSSDGGGSVNWNVTVPQAPELSLGLTINAGSGTASLAGANLSSINATVNSGTARLELGGVARLDDANVTVNLGQATIVLPAGGSSANLSLNAGSLNVCIPANAAVRVRWNGSLGSNDLADSGLTEVDGGTWVSAGFVESAPHLELHVTANAGSFELDTDGTCDA